MNNINGSIPSIQNMRSIFKRRVIEDKAIEMVQP
jgi:hypothetical protein